MNNTIFRASAFLLLCARLGVFEHSLKLWADGKARIPERVFLQVADIVLEDDVARAHQDRRGAPRVAAIGATADAENSPRRGP